MSQMGYDAATIGNHDFDNGIDGLVKQLNHAKFPFIISNYDFTDTSMDGKYLKYKVFNKGGIKIGVFGIGIKLEGLVPKSLYQNTLYQDPIEKSNYYSDYLKILSSFLISNRFAKDVFLTSDSKMNFAIPKVIDGGAHHMGTVPLLKNKIIINEPITFSFISSN